MNVWAVWQYGGFGTKRLEGLHATRCGARKQARRLRLPRAGYKPPHKNAIVVRKTPVLTENER